MLELKNIDSYYGESRVIEDLSFNVPKGKIVGFIGRNGVGKSSTLKSIMGIVKTPSGQVIFNGEDITKKPVYERVKLGIGYVPQGRDIFPQMTVQEKIELGLQPLGGKEYCRYFGFLRGTVSLHFRRFGQDENNFRSGGEYLCIFRQSRRNKREAEKRIGKS